MANRGDDFLNAQLHIDYALCRSQIADAPHAQWQKFHAIRTHSLSFMPTICITLVLLGPMPYPYL